MFANVLKVNRTITFMQVFRPFNQYFVEAPLAAIYSLESSWVWRCKFGTPVFGEFLPFLSAAPLKLCQVGWGALLRSYFQVSPEMFNRVQVRALAGPLKDIQRLVPMPLLCCLGCVLSVIVLLEGEPFHQGSLCTLLCSSLPLSWLVSAEKHPLSMMLPPCFTVGMVAGFLQMWCLAFRPKSSI